MDSKDSNEVVKEDWEYYISPRFRSAEGQAIFKQSMLATDNLEEGLKNTTNINAIKLAKAEIKRRRRAKRVFKKD